MAVYVVGDFLRETRLRRGYTQEEVSYGICTPASLSRIENGAQKPGRLILEKLFERLGTENNLFNSFVSREEMELYSAIQELVRNITDDDVAYGRSGNRRTTANQGKEPFLHAFLHEREICILVSGARQLLVHPFHDRWERIPPDYTGDIHRLE